MSHRQVLFTALRYDDAPAAIDFLESAFGFERQMVAPGETEGEVAHAQLVLNGAMVMLGSAKDDGLGMKRPGEPVAATQGIYMIVDDVDEHYARAVEGGAKIAREIDDTPYGSREYCAHDPEGNFWSFGTYDPFAEV